MSLRVMWLLCLLILSPVAMAKDKWKAHKGYDGADPPATELVHLKVSQDTDRRILWDTRGLRIASIDGKLTQNLWYPSILVDEILLKPGKHRIGYVATNLGGKFAHVDLWFVAEPGRSYATRTVTTPFTVRVWIEEAETGVQVGGIVGSEDEPQDGPAIDDQAQEAARAQT